MAESCLGLFGGTFIRLRRKLYRVARPIDLGALHSVTMFYPESSMNVAFTPLFYYCFPSARRGQMQLARAAASATNGLRPV